MFNKENFFPLLDNSAQTILYGLPDLSSGSSLISSTKEHSEVSLLKFCENAKLRFPDDYLRGDNDDDDDFGIYPELDMSTCSSFSQVEQILKLLDVNEIGEKSEKKKSVNEWTKPIKKKVIEACEKQKTTLRNVKEKSIINTHKKPVSKPISLEKALKKPSTEGCTTPESQAGEWRNPLKKIPKNEQATKRIIINNSKTSGLNNLL